jgi:thiamine-phosphate pyrophosphorylase
MIEEWGLYVITDAGLSRGRSHTEVLREAIAGGAAVVQLRDKDLTTRELVEEGQKLRSLTLEMGAALIVNDRIDVALAVEADGVHVGPDDMPVALARELVGPGRILGASAGTVDEARAAQADGADYLGVGSVYATGTKADAGEPIGPEGLARIAASISIPVVGIGGIAEANAGEVIAAGGEGVAVISAVVSADDVQAAARRLLERIRVAKEIRDE